MRGALLVLSKVLGKVILVNLIEAERDICPGA